MAAYGKKKFPVFLVGYLVFLMVQVSFWAYVLNYVRDSLLAYEAAQPEHVVEALVQELEGGNVEAYISFPTADNEFEEPDIVKQQYIAHFAGKEIEFEKSPGSYDVQNPVYDLYADNRKIAAVKLKEIASESLMFILSVQEWEIASVEPVLETGEKGLLIHIPDNCTVELNGIKVDKEKYLTGRKWELEELQYAAAYTAVPEMVEYQVTGLFEFPEVKLYNCFGQEMEYTEEESVIEFTGFPEVPVEGELEVLAADALQNAINYSNFFSKDLPGSNKSVEPIQYMFPEESEFLVLAENYRRHDMWMYSDHNTPVFENERVSDFKWYSDTLFSCNVYFEKMMVLTKTGEVRTVVTNDTYYYADFGGEWKVVDMRAIVEE